MPRDNFSDLEDTHYGYCNKSDVETKIYPLAKFAYSFQRRFNELASPVEAFHFKLASIDRSEWQAKLNPTNEWQCFYAKSIHALLYDGENDYVDIWEDAYADSDYYYQRKVNDVAHYMVDDKLTLRNVNSTAAANNIFKRICHMPCDIILENCTIDNKFLPCMANSNKLSWNWHYITFKSCRFTTSNIIDNIYKNRVRLNRLRFENCKDFDWISDLLRAERNNLELLSISGDIDDVFLNATEADFAKIFTPGKYDENFQIILRFPESTWSEIETKVMSILGNNFWQGGDNADLKILCENDVRRFNFKSLKWKLDQIKVSYSKLTKGQVLFDAICFLILFCIVMFFPIFITYFAILDLQKAGIL